jgi:hypothetical protein
MTGSEEYRGRLGSLIDVLCVRNVNSLAAGIQQASAKGLQVRASLTFMLRAVPLDRVP